MAAKVKPKSQAQAKPKSKSRPKSRPKSKTAPGRKKTVARKSPVKKRAPAGKDKSGGYSDRSHWAKKTKPKASEQPLMKTLRAEHHHMGTVMQLFSQQLDSIEAGELIDPHLVYEIMDYMVTWPDRFHHPREDLIYARVAELDPGGADEVDTLQRDHDNTGDLGRGLLRAVEQWREGEIIGNKLIKLGRDYIEHIYDHMKVEEKVVFPHIESVLKTADWRELEAEDQLAAVSSPIFGPKVQREFRNVARRLRRGLRRSVERQAVEEWIDIEAFMESLEVLSMAYESSRHTAGEHLRSAMKDAADMFLDNPLSAPLKMAANNTRVTFDLLGDVAGISRETLQDLVKVNQERKDRVRLLHRNSPRA